MGAFRDWQLQSGYALLPLPILQLPKLSSHLPLSSVYPDAVDNYLVDYNESFKEIRHQTLPRPEREPALSITSWSHDGRFLAGQFNALRAEDAGIGIYTLATKRFERLTRSGSWPLWLPDSRQLLYLDKGSVLCYDTEKKAAHVVIDSKEGPVINDYTVSHDGRVICFVRHQSEGDIWLATLR